MNKKLISLLPEQNPSRILVPQISTAEIQFSYSPEEASRLSKICLSNIYVSQALLHQTNISCHLLGPLTRQVQNKTQTRKDTSYIL